MSSAGGVQLDRVRDDRPDTTDLPDVTALGMVVDGHAVTGSGAPVAVTSPATGALLVELGTAGSDDVDRAAKAAKRAHERVWSKLSGGQRARHLYRVSAALAAHADELALIAAMEGGTPVRASRAVGLPAAVATARHHAGWADKLANAGFGPGPDGAGPRARGVAGVVVSSSSSLLATVALVWPALACGATVVLKPSATAPLATLALVAAAQEAGLPPGVLNVLVGGDAVGSALLTHPDVAAVGLAGTTALVSAVQRSQIGSSRRVITRPVCASVAVVADDAPLAGAADGIVATMCSARAGQASTGAVVLADAAIAAELTELLAARVAELVVADPVDAATDLGPCSSTAQRDGMLDLLRAASGAQRVSPAPDGRAGAWLAPTVLTGTGERSELHRTELLGPLLVVEPMADAAASVTALRRASLPTSLDLWTTDQRTATRLAARSGSVTVRLHEGADDEDPPAVEFTALGPARLAGWLDV